MIQLINSEPSHLGSKRQNVPLLKYGKEIGNPDDQEGIGVERKYPGYMAHKNSKNPEHNKLDPPPPPPLLGT